MSNAFYQNIYVLDTAGTIVTDRPVWVKKVVLYPNAAADVAVLKFWNRES
jgi:hypothetical protein